MTDRPWHSPYIGMVLRTKTKIALASLAYRAIATARALVGRNNYVTVRRRGVLWHLDLREGIDFSIYLLGSFERSTVIALESLVKPGNVIFDIGANIGAHTLGLARAAGPSGCVFAFEPSDFAFAKLKANLNLNPDLELRTEAHQILFAAEVNAPLPNEIYASWPLAPETHSHVHPKHRGRLLTTSHGHVDTLDSYAERRSIDRLDLIKIDVDGDEYPVLKGGARTLDRFRPILLMEMSPYVHSKREQDFAALVTLLRDTGYSLQEASTSKPLPLEVNELEALVPDGASINVVARATETINKHR
jgi:FkbM family methyltransferase